jgi:hypothetical protein
LQQAHGCDLVSLPTSVTGPVGCINFSNTWCYHGRLPACQALMHRLQWPSINALHASTCNTATKMLQVCHHVGCILLPKVLQTCAAAVARHQQANLLGAPTV